MEQLITANKIVLKWKNYQTIELQDNQLLRRQIDSVLDNLDINTILDPNMLNTGSMEVMATIKRDLSIKLEAMLAAQDNLSGESNESIFN